MEGEISESWRFPRTRRVMLSVARLFESAIMLFLGLAAGWADSVGLAGHGYYSESVGEVEVSVDIVLVAADECEVDVVPG